MKKVTTNFGQINGRRVMTFKVTNDGRVMPARFRRMEDGARACTFWDMWISARESFRRWKIARKAWQTRKHKNQLSLGL